MERYGLSREDYDGEVVEVWPENWQAFRLFHDLQTQWRGAGKVVGLDYNVLFRKLDRMGLTPEQYDDLEEEIRQMEFEAIDTMSPG